MIVFVLQYFIRDTGFSSLGFFSFFFSFLLFFFFFFAKFSKGLKTLRATDTQEAIAIHNN